MKVIECPITYFEGNLYFNGAGGCWAAYKLDGYNYAFQSDPTKINILVRQVQLIKNVSHVKIMVVPTMEDIDKHAENVRRRVRQDDCLSASALDHLGKTSDYLKTMGKEYWNEYTTYLLVKLELAVVNDMELAGRELGQFFKEPVYSLTAFLGLQRNDITTVRYRQLLQMEGDTYSALSPLLEMQRLTTAEAQWLLKRVNFRGTDKPVILNKAATERIDEKTGVTYQEITENWSPAAEAGQVKAVEYFRPYRQEVANLFDGVLSVNGRRGMKVTHDDGMVSYQSFLVVTNIPKRYEFPGKEWIYLLQKEPMQVELCIDITNVHYKVAQEDLENKTTEVNTQIDNLVQAGGRQFPDELREAQSQIPELNRELKNNKLPMSKVRISLCLSGSDEQQVEDRVKSLQAYFDRNDFAAVRPGADQQMLYFQHIPGGETYIDCFTQRLSPFVVASGIFGAVNRVGDNLGYYIGIADGKPVYLYLGQACKENKSPACILIGDLGYGKSFNANLLLFLHVLFGGYGFVICPKGERANWDKMPYIGPYVNKVALTTDDENKGKLDPYNIYRHDVEYASSLAATVITELLGMDQSSNEYVVLNECVNLLKKDSRASMMKLVTLIGMVDKKDDYYKDAQRLHRNLSAIMQLGYAKLIFGDGSEEAINIDGRLNLIMLSGVTFPDSSVKEEKYNSEQKLSMTLMLLISSFIRKFSLMHPDVFKMTLVDESWALSSNPIGASMIEWVGRQGRSLYSSIVLNGHSVLDLPNEKLKTTMTYKFCFHTSDRDEAIRMLEFLKIDTSEENITILMKLKNRQCLFSDLNGRVSKLTFDAVFGDLIEFFSTTPTDRATERTEAVTEETEAEDEQEPEVNLDEQKLMEELEALIRTEQTAV